MAVSTVALGQDARPTPVRIVVAQQQRIRGQTVQNGADACFRENEGSSGPAPSGALHRERGDVALLPAELHPDQVDRLPQ